MVPVADRMGNIVYERIGFADDRNLDIQVAHAFGRFEATAVVVGGAGDDALGGSIAFDTRSVPARVYVASRFSLPRDNGSYFHGQTLGATHKLVLVPGRLSLQPNAGVTINEIRRVNGTNSTLNRDGFIASAGVFLFAYVQIAWRFALSSGGSVRFPLAQSDGFDSKPSLMLGSYLVLGLPKWDFYVGGNLYDCTRPDPETFFTFGIRARWGL